MTWSRRRSEEVIVSVADALRPLETDYGYQFVFGYLAATFLNLLSNPRFTENLPGHLAGDPASQARLPILLERFNALAAG